MLQIKVVEHWIPYKKVGGHICLSPPGVELGCSKDCYLLKYYKFSFNCDTTCFIVDISIGSAHNLFSIKLRLSHVCASWISCVTMFMNLCIRSSHGTQQLNHASHFTGYVGIFVMGAPFWLPCISLHSHAITMQFLQCVQTLKTKISLRFHFISLPYSSGRVLYNLNFRQSSCG